MRAVFRWLFGDIASVVAPAADRGSRSRPTRRAARWLIGIGLFVAFFGTVVAVEGVTLERQDATVVERYTTRFRANRTTSRLHKVRLRLESGDRKVVTHEPLYKALGARTEVPVEVDIDPSTNLVDAIYLDGRRYATARRSAYEVVTIVIAAFGYFLLLRGIGRLRRVRLLAREGEAPAG